MDLRPAVASAQSRNPPPRRLGDGTDQGALRALVGAAELSNHRARANKKPAASHLAAGFLLAAALGLQPVTRITG